jgi:Holliday junction resolvase
LPNRNYEKGVRSELAIKKMLESDEQIVVRSAGSKGAVDLVSRNLEFVTFIQVKNGQYDTKGSRLEELRQEAKDSINPNSVYELWTKIKGKNAYMVEDLKTGDKTMVRQLTDGTVLWDAPDAE